jgi:membrane protease YdiL (CAAX protease family)
MLYRMSTPPPPRPDLPETNVPPPATWKAVEAIPVFVLTLFASVLFSLPVLAIRSCSGRFIGSTLGGEIAFGVTVVVWIRFVNHGSLSALGFPHRPLGDLAAGLGTGAAAIIVAGMVLALVRSVATGILGHTPADPQQVVSCVRGTALAFLAPVVILVAPICEEIFFRGFLFKGLRRRFSAWPAALISGAFFGLVHFGGFEFLLIIPSLAVVGVALALVYERRQSLLASIAAHALFNVIGFLSIAFSRH